MLRIDEAAQGREMLRRVIPYVATAEDWWVPSIPAWMGIAFTYQGPRALGLPIGSQYRSPITYHTFGFIYGSVTECRGS